MNLVERTLGFKKHEIFGLCGIYIIKCNINNKCYIGESKNIWDRFDYHLQRLINNKHDNDYLQKAFNRYGIANFTFDIIELCEEYSLSIREHHWVHILYTDQRTHGYNLRSTNPNERRRFTEETRLKMKAVKKLQIRHSHSEDTKFKMSIAQLGKKLTEETKEKLRKANLGKKASTETKLKMSLAHKNRQLKKLYDNVKK